MGNKFLLKCLRTIIVFSFFMSLFYNWLLYSDSELLGEDTSARAKGYKSAKVFTATDMLPVNDLCQVGFGLHPCPDITADAGCYGYNVVVILTELFKFAAVTRPIKVTVYDAWLGNPTERDAALVWITQRFPRVVIHVVRGFPLQTIGAPPSHVINSVSCQLIHIDIDVFFSTSPRTDMKSIVTKMAHLASRTNLLLVSSSRNVTEELNESFKEGLLTTSTEGMLRPPNNWLLVASYNGDKIVFPSLENRRKGTVVLLGYWMKRLDNLQIIMPYYSSLHHLIDQVLFIWNNQEVSIPQNFTSLATSIHYLCNGTTIVNTLVKKHYKLEVPITIVVADKNSMNNRFNVSRFLRSDPVIVLDDDIIVNATLINRMLKAWHSSPTNMARIVGLDHRGATKKGSYVPIVKKKQQSSIVLGKTMLFHRKYLEMYVRDSILVNYTETTFCEDIAMSALVLNTTCIYPLILKSSKLERRTMADYKIGVSGSTKKWYNLRHVCVRFMQKHFSPNVFHCSSP